MVKLLFTLLLCFLFGIGSSYMVDASTGLNEDDRSLSYGIDNHLSFSHIVDSGDSNITSDNNYILINRKAKLNENVITDVALNRGIDKMNNTLKNFSNAKYKPTLYADVDTVNGENIDLNKVYRSNSWREGFIGHWFNINISDIKAVRGVYSHFRSFGKEILESSNATVNLLENSLYRTYNGVSINFSESADRCISDKFCEIFNVNIDKNTDIKNSLESNNNTNLFYAFNTYYSYSNVYTKKLSTSLQINSNTALYCPNEYYITLGYIGNYYVVSYEYTHMKNIWGKGDLPVDKTIKGKLVLVEEPKLSLTYVLLDQQSDSINTYYC